MFCSNFYIMWSYEARLTINLLDWAEILSRSSINHADSACTFISNLILLDGPIPLCFTQTNHNFAINYCANRKGHKHATSTHMPQSLISLMSFFNQLIEKVKVNHIYYFVLVNHIYYFILVNHIYYFILVNHIYYFVLVNYIYYLMWIY